MFSKTKSLNKLPENSPEILPGFFPEISPGILPGVPRMTPPRIPQVVAPKISARVYQHIPTTEQSVVAISGYISGRIQRETSGRNPEAIR